MTTMIAGDVVKFVRCTQEEYESIENKDPSTVYFVSSDFSLYKVQEEHSDE